MIEHVNKTINMCEEVKYNDDEKLDKLKIVRTELKEDYLVQHLRRCALPATSCYLVTAGVILGYLSIFNLVVMNVIFPSIHISCRSHVAVSVAVQKDIQMQTVFVYGSVRTVFVSRQTECCSKVSLRMLSYFCYGRPME